jgi:hypothetical protein
MKSEKEINCRKQIDMENKYFLLGTGDTNKIIKIFQIIFGVACLSIAFFWLSFNLKTIASDGTLWITLIFLSGFGTYQILAGFGRATRFIEIGNHFIILKKNSILPPVNVQAKEIENIELFPLSVRFFLKTKRTILLRLGTTFYEINEKIKDEILNFARTNQIPVEIIEEKLFQN